MFTCEGYLLLCLPICAPHHLDNGQAILLCEFMISGVMCGHRHDGPAAVAAQHVVCNPDGHPLARGRVQSEATCTSLRLSAACTKAAQR